MKKNISLLFLALALSLAVHAQNDLSVAVFDPAGEVDAVVKEVVREEVSSIVVNAKGYMVLERQLINKVLEENKFQQGGLVDDSQIIEVGKRMGANYVFVTTISKLDKNFYISCKMIEVLTAKIEKQKTGQTAKGLNDIVQTVQTVVNNMLGVTTESTVQKPPQKQTKYKTIIKGGQIKRVPVDDVYHKE
jgi:hypothetical protein